MMIQTLKIQRIENRNGGRKTLPLNKSESEDRGGATVLTVVDEGKLQGVKYFSLLLSTTQKAVSYLTNSLVTQLKFFRPFLRSLFLPGTWKQFCQRYLRWQLKVKAANAAFCYLHTGQLPVRVISYDNATSFFSSMRPSVCEFSQGRHGGN